MKTMLIRDSLTPKRLIAGRFTASAALAVLVWPALLLWGCAGTDPPPEEPVVLDDQRDPNATREPAIPVVSAEHEDLGPQRLIEISEAALEALPGAVEPVLSGGDPVLRVHDLTGDGTLEVLVLAADAGVEDALELGELARYGRLFEPHRDPIPFYLFVLTIRDPEEGAEEFARASRELEFEPLHDIYLDRHRVLEGFETLRITDEALPLAASVQFRTTEGILDNWITFTGPSDRYGRFTMQHTIDRRWHRYDVDGSGTIDLLSFQSGFEEGVGRETLISWYRWDGTEFRLHRTRDIVRNLNRFLYTSRTYLEHGDRQAFLDHALTREDRRRVENRELSFEETLQAIFRPTAVESIEDYGIEDYDSVLTAEDLERVVFPVLGANPFPNVAGATSFTPVVRIECCDGVSGFYHTTVTMAYNPFEQQQFYLELQSIRE